jgi:predicted Zn-dependent protease
VNQHFKEKNFEMALIELNQLLAFYPNSPKLLKMKGTLLVKTGNRDLAMRSWQRALDLTPGDASLRRSIDRLNERILAERNARELSRPKAQDPEASPGAASQSRPAH